MSDRMSEDIPDRMSEDMPDRMSEDMLDMQTVEYVAIYAIVEIIRSEVTNLFSSFLYVRTYDFSGHQRTRAKFPCKSC